MSSGKEWLGKMKKGELSDMAEHLKIAEYVFLLSTVMDVVTTMMADTRPIDSYAKAKKNDLELMIEEFLNSNKSALSKDNLVAPFYGNPEGSSPEVEKKKPRRRQTIKAKETEPV